MLIYEQSHYYFFMKRILYTFLAALAAASTSPGVENSPAAETAAAPATTAEEETEASSDDVIAAYRKQMAQTDQVFASLKSPSRLIQSRYPSHVEDVNTHLKKMEETKNLMEELAAKKQDIVASEYVFSIVLPEDRDKYEREGAELAKRVMSLLSAKQEASQIEGLRQFEVMRESYQGLPQYKEAYSLYQKTVSKLEKKWSGLREAMRRERQKWQQKRLDQQVEAETAQYEALARKMEAEDRNIDEDWFVPKVSNSVMLDRALDRVKRAKTSQQNRYADSAANVPELMRKFWSSMDDCKALMAEGKYDEAIDGMSNNETYRTILGLGRYNLPENYKEDIRKQYENMREEVRRRQNELRTVSRSEQNAASTFERESQYVNTRITNMAETLDNEKEEETRRAEEAAAREAEIKAEEERAAREAAAEEEEEEDEEEVKPKKKKKGSKKKKAE